VPEIEQPSELLPETTSKVNEPLDRSKNVYDSHHNRSTKKYAQVSKMYILQNAHEYDETQSLGSTLSVNSEEGTIEQSISPEILSRFDDKMFVYTTAGLYLYAVNHHFYSFLLKFYSDQNVERIPFQKLKTITRNFDPSCKLGKGAFGAVYHGELNNVDLAIKVLETCAIEHFERELIILSGNINHPRLLSPTAISIDEIPCLIYPYMPHGSLEDRLALKVNTCSKDLPYIVVPQTVNDFFLSV
jgi:hypothetical protein